MQRETATTTVKALVGLTYVAMIATNVLANALPINGRTTGAVSDSYQNLFAPAGLTFAIWGVIYLLLGAHVLYQFGLFHDAAVDDVAPFAGSASASSGNAPTRAALLQRVGVLFSLSSLANVAWILSWHYDLILMSTLLLATMLVLLILITRTILGARLSPRDRLFVRLPFSVYFGWITVATIANVYPDSTHVAEVGLDTASDRTIWEWTRKRCWSSRRSIERSTIQEFIQEILGHSSERYSTF